MRARLVVGVLLTAALLTACSGSDQAEVSDQPAGHGGSAAADPAAIGWSPCDGVSAAQVGSYAGQPMSEQNGTADEQRCTFTPVRTGGPAFDVNYLWFDGGLDEALDSMGATGARLRPVDVAGADAARVVVDARRSGLLVTGFVQTDGLVQSVNAAQLAPYDREQAVSATTALLAELAKQAPTTPEA